MISNNICLNKIYQAKKISMAKGPEAALPLAREIMNSLPDQIGVLSEFADLAKMLGEYTIAIGALVKASNLDPKNATIIASLGAILATNHQYDAAEKQLLKAIELQPDLWTAHKDLGAVYAALKRYPDGIPYLKRAIDLKPSHPEMYANLAACLLKTQHYEEALKYADKAIKLNADNESTYNTIGNALVELGRLDEAEEYFLKAIKINHLSGPAYSNLTLAKKFSGEDIPFIKKVENLLKESMSSYDRSYIHFALSKMYNDIKEWEKAFNHAKNANLLEVSKREENPPPKNYFNSIKKIFTKKFFDTYKNIGNNSKTPIFIVGMPRSGTSLTEQIISTHPLAAGAGELGDIHLFANSFGSINNSKEYQRSIEKILTVDTIEEIASKYLKTLRQGREHAEKITDKMPENYFHLGFIFLLFPNAKIVHIMRNPLDTCLSCYFQPFPNLDWSFNTTWIANRYKFYRNIMNYWHKVLPKGSILDLNYEDLIAHPEESARKLISFCDLEWDPACLEFYKTDRAVNTASVWQVRQPLYKTSVKRWQKYGPAIRELATPLAKYLDKDDIDALNNMGIKIKKGLLF